MIEEFRVPAKVAKKIVRQVDRARTGRAKTLAQYWTITFPFLADGGAR
jgi:hypothetical protein